INPQGHPLPPPPRTLRSSHRVGPIPLTQQTCMTLLRTPRTHTKFPVFPAPAWTLEKRIVQEMVRKIVPLDQGNLEAPPGSCSSAKNPRNKCGTAAQFCLKLSGHGPALARE